MRIAFCIHRQDHQEIEKKRVKKIKGFVSACCCCRCCSTRFRYHIVSFPVSENAFSRLYKTLCRQRSAARRSSPRPFILRRDRPNTFSIRVRAQRPSRAARRRQSSRSIVAHSQVNPRRSPGNRRETCSANPPKPRRPLLPEWGNSTSSWALEVECPDVPERQMTKRQHRLAKYRRGNREKKRDKKSKRTRRKSKKVRSRRRLLPLTT